MRIYYCQNFQRSCELLRSIFDYLPWKSVLQSSMVCVEWKYLCSEEKLWKERCLSMYHISLDSFNKTKALSAQESFRNIHLQMTNMIQPLPCNTSFILPLSFQPHLLNFWSIKFWMRIVAEANSIAYGDFDYSAIFWWFCNAMLCFWTNCRKQHYIYYCT